jgi:hypothetical protein
MALRAPRVALQIERIIVDGLPLASRARFRHAFEEECALALEGARFADAVPGTARVDLALPPGASAEEIGRALARGIVRLVSRT